MVLGLPRPSLCVVLLACVAADSFPFSGGAEIEQANEKQASEGARLGRLEKERKRLLRRL